MASSAFKSTTRRTSLGGNPAGAEDSSGNSSNKAHRRSRSLSRVSHGPSRYEEPDQADFGYNAAPRGKFVNTTRGSGVPEISLDDLAIEFFSQEERESGDRGMSGRRASGIGHWANETASSKRRGRSVSRQGSKTSTADRKSVTADRSRSNLATSDASSRRRRSVSSVRCQISDSESDADHYRNSSSQIDTKKNQSNRISDFPSSMKPTAVNNAELRRSFSQKDMPLLHDGYSSHSSALTDDDTKDALTCKSGVEKTIRAVYAQKKGVHPNGDVVNGELYEAMRKELRHAVEEIKSELEQTMGKKTSGSKSGHVARKNYISKLEPENQRDRDVQIVKEPRPDTKYSAAGQKQPRRKRSNDRNRTSKQLNEEAEKFFEDFIANIEDTDFSSFDGERSDGSSTLGGIAKPRGSITYGQAVNQSPEGSNCHPVGTDGVIFPWLQWETSNDGSFTPKNEVQTPVSMTSVCDVRQDITSPQNDSYSISSQGSWSPAILQSQQKNRTIYTIEDGGNISGELESCQSSGFDMAEYNKLKRSEELLFERYRERNRISSGGLLLCGHFL